jgi:ribosomal protein S18 acetylase RimI-like enzyme
MNENHKTSEVVSLSRTDIKKATCVFKRSFTNDPIMNYIYPVDKMSDKLSTTYFGFTVRYYWEYGAILKPKNLEGISIWVPPRKLKIKISGVLKSRLYMIPVRLGREAFGRLNVIMEQSKKYHIKYAPGPHYYLMVLAVDPDHQSKGFGSALMRPVLQKADEEGLPCYLEASNERVIPLYQRHGFKVMEEIKIPDGPSLWAMRRETKQK